MDKKILIVGQGLVGSALTHQLIKRGYSCTIIDDNHKNSSSITAGGITHPMSFKRLILSWRAIEFITLAKSFYKTIEEELEVSFFQDFDLHRPIANADEKAFWLKRMTEEGYKDVLEYSENIDLKGVQTPFGSGIVKTGGRLDTDKYLSAMRSSFGQRVLAEKFDFSELTVNENNVDYKGEKYTDVVFCEGFQFINNPYFNYLPHNCTKGEVITVSSEQLPKKWVSKNGFVIPDTSGDGFFIGATYEWNNLDLSITEAGKSKLIEKVEKIGITDAKVTSQSCGIRPTMHDRRPLIGTHPVYKALHIFNGMGSKGVMLAPYFASHFIDFLEKKTELDVEVNISRWRKYAYKEI